MIIFFIILLFKIISFCLFHFTFPGVNLPCRKAWINCQSLNRQKRSVKKTKRKSYIRELFSCRLPKATRNIIKSIIQLNKELPGIDRKPFIAEGLYAVISLNLYIVKHFYSCVYL